MQTMKYNFLEKFQKPCMMISSLKTQGHFVMTSHVVKSSLAKLLATENISIEHKSGIHTAAFDLKSRQLFLPVWDGISNDLYDMMIVHEVGHALDTPSNGWKNAIKKLAAKHCTDPATMDVVEKSIHTFLNIVEDVRIDKRQKRRYPGSKRNYVAGLEELHTRDFFGIANKDANELSFIDRANLYYKGMPTIKLKNDQERNYISRMGNTESFDEVISLAEEIFEYAKTEETQPEEALELSIEMFLDSLGSDGKETESDQKAKSDNTADGSDGEDNASDATLKKDAGFDAPDQTDRHQDSPGADIKKIQKQAKDHNIPIAVTVLAAEKNAKDLVSKKQVFYAKIPSVNENNMMHFVHDYSKVIPEMESSIKTAWGISDDEKLRIRESLQDWKLEAKDTISYMVKEFEQKKAADIYQRLTVAKTGVIDTNKLHSYKFSEDIFRRNSILPQGKNHGFFMILDWSGSMASELLSTIKQLFSLVMFAKRIQVPFEVYLFKSNHGGIGTPFSSERDDLSYNGFTLRNILSSRMNNDMYNRALNALWFAGRWGGINSDPMGGTPLNETLITSVPLIKKFRDKNRLQVVSTIVLTDGGSDQSGLPHIFNRSPGDDVYVQDTVTKKTYAVKTSYDVTSALIDSLRERTGSTTLGFYLYDGSFLSMPLVEKSTANEMKWKNENYLALTSAGYDEYYIMKCRESRSSAPDWDSLNANAKRGTIANTFNKILSKKKFSKTMLDKFINQVVNKRFT